MSFLARPLAWLGAYEWHGPRQLDPALRFEWRFIAARWLGILLVAAGLPLASLSEDRLVAAYSVLGAAAIYNLLLQITLPRLPNAFGHGYLTTVGDTLLNIVLVSVGGGFNSPFYFLLFGVVVSAAMRWGRVPACITALLFIGFDVAQHIRLEMPIGAPIVFRSGFLILTAFLAGYLREQARQAEMALEGRLRQTNVLNQATAAIGASLEVERVLNAVANAASHLFGEAMVVLRPSADLADSAQTQALLTITPLGARPELEAQLEALTAHYPSAENGDEAHAQPFYHERLPSGQEALVVVIAVPSRQTSLATLAAACPAGGPLPRLDDDILASFSERVTLALENASLYRRLTRRSADLQRAYADLASAHQELVRVDEMKTNFLANVSHEFRTPLTSIRSFSELLLVYREDLEVQHEFLGIINSESERLTRMVNDVLDITKIESGTMEWQMRGLDIADIIREASRLYGPILEKQNLTLGQAIEEPLPLVVGDRDRLLQVISNLLSNALKFTPQGSVTLAARPAGGEVHVAVTDTGIGVAGEDQDRIFDKFQQVGAMLTDKPRGTGLGLSICREIMEHHGGRIWVDSRRGEGSTFSIALPIAVEDAAQPRRSAIAASS